VTCEPRREEPSIFEDCRFKRRLAIESIQPQVDGGTFPVKREIGEPFGVQADLFADGHDVVSAVLLVRSPRSDAWAEVPMHPRGNDSWEASFDLDEIGEFRYAVAGWIDPIATWIRDAGKKLAAGLTLTTDLAELDSLVRSAAAVAETKDREPLGQLLAQVGAAIRAHSPSDVLRLLDQPSNLHLIQGRLRTGFARSHDLTVRVDRRRAQFSAWYELVPRSQSSVDGRHGTFDDVIARLPELEDMGFDVLYLTPIHPIGRANRKGRNNSLKAGAEDPGSPYAIGAEDGGHTAIHRELGTFADFDRLLAAARKHGMEIALDFAIQCSPDHPWIKEHPDWFEWRPDGSIKYAENPPKKYEDIVNVSFYGRGYPALWLALRDVVLFWVDKGVSIFRVDNPHTKPFAFWQWLIQEVHAKHPDVIFLSEAFTRPKIMHYLAKLGFTQSYSYFTWRNTKRELTEYIEELARPPACEYMRPNFFTNTPDINPYFLQSSGRAGFQIRLLLAATLGTNYGIYSGFELCEAAAIPGKEEYADSEKYQLKVWDWNRPGHIKDDVKRLNALRKRSPALQLFSNVTFYNAWNDSILYYGKKTLDSSDFLLFAVNLDPHNAHGAHFEVPLWEFGLPDTGTIEAEDVVLGRRFSWTGKVQHMWLDPGERPYAIWRLLPPEGGRRGW
jgi:starch synthase (maltosyl-transferring)